MEIEGEDGSKIEVGRGSKAVFGRGCGFTTKDRTVSRRHVIFELDDNQTVSFQVVGKNPVWVRSVEESVKIFRRLEKGVVASGDWFCISSQNPVWFCLKERIGGRRRVEESDSGSLDSERFDLSKIDPVKEFGFLVIGHEFDCYPKQRIKDARSWDWFIEEPEQDSEGGESFERKKKSGMGKRKKKVGGNDDDDDDWSGESEDDKEIVGKIRKVDRQKYSTRSKERAKPRQDTKRKIVSARKSNEDDETLGGFIVDEEEEQGEEGDEEEEELIDDDDDEEEEELED